MRGEKGKGKDGGKTRISATRGISLVEKIPGTVYQMAIGSNGAITVPFVSKGLAEMIGRRIEEIRKDPQLMVHAIHPEDRDRVIKTVLSASGAWNLEFRIQSIRGTRWVESRGTSTRQRNGGILWTCISSDITEKKKAEEEHKDSEDRYHRLVELSPELILLVSDDRIVYANPAALRSLCALTPEDVIGKSIWSFIHPDAQQIATERKKELLAGKSVPFVEHKCIRLDGTQVDLEVAAAPASFHGRQMIQVMARDISLRKKSEQLLKDVNDQLVSWNSTLAAKIEQATADLEKEIAERKKAEETIRLVFNGISDPLIMLNEDRTIAILNRTAQKYLRILRTESVIGQTCFRVFWGRTNPCEGCQLPQVLSSGQPVTYERKGGFDPSRIEQVSIYPISDPNGNQRFAFRISDITESRSVERQLMQSEKLASLGLMISGIAHEINNPNNFLFFNIPILKDYLKEIMPIVDDFAQSSGKRKWMGMSYSEFKKDLFLLLENLEHGTQRINTTISRLNEFGRRKDKIEKRWAELRGIMEKALALSQGQIRPMVKTLEMDVPPDSVILTDSQALEQVLVNLLINAAHASDKADAWVRLTARKGNSRPDSWIIEVTDNGCGISPQVREKIFDPFFTTKPAGTGTGLGLYICQTVVETLGGRIEVESEAGKGTMFRVILPGSERRTQKRSLELAAAA